MDIKKSDFLLYLLNSAENIRSVNGLNSLTVECFVFSLTEYIGNLSKHEQESAEWIGYQAEYEQTLAVYKEMVGIEPDALGTALRKYLESGKPLSTLDMISLKTAMLRVERTAVEQKAERITAGMLLGAVMKSPTKNLMAIIASVKNPEQCSDSAKLLSELESMFSSSKKSGLELDKGETATDVSSETSAYEESVAGVVKKVKDIRDKLLDTVFGQDNAINVFARGYFQYEMSAMTDKKRRKPGATFLFAGPPGVGKTYLAESVASLLKLPYKRFDMSEFSDREAVTQLCGSDQVYKNAQAGALTSFVDEHPKCVLLFDEIEKAHINAIHVFLQVLDAGRLRDIYTKKEVSFKDAIIIFTTNAGKQLYEEAENGNFSAISRKVILNAIEKDTNVETGVPFFPPALCSRFASGNVVMFNHIDAHDLANIARSEIRRIAGNLEKEIGIICDVDEKVYSSIIFGEGGSADARTVKGRAGNFFDGELFELLRLVESTKTVTGASKLEHIEFDVELPENNPEVSKLFVGESIANVLVFGSAEIYSLCNADSAKCKFLHAETLEQAKKIIEDNDISFIICDICYGRVEGGEGYLNIEDINSKGRDFFRYATEYYTSIPLFVLKAKEGLFTHEEEISFMRNGARDLIVCVAGSTDEYVERVNLICDSLHQQQSMMHLAKASRVVTFETAQTVSADGKSARVTLFDFRLNVALDSADMADVLSNMSMPDVRFDQVIGAEDAKDELKYFVDYLKNPKKYAGSGVKSPRGVLLYGPPGTGKTMLAKAVAAESGVTFIAAEGNQFIKKYVGEGEESVHRLFRTARKYAPSVLFIDEIDAIGKERRGGGDGGSDTRESILTAFLTEMDGFKTNTDKPVFVLAATNFNVEPGTAKSLDEALMRRFDRRVYIDLPTYDERVRFFKLKHSTNKAFQLSDKGIENIAMRSTGMSLAALDSVCELALRTAIRKNSLVVNDEVFEDAFETFNSGDKKQWSDETLERVARHEAGHAFICWHGGEIPSYITVVARGDHGGYMQHANREDKAILVRKELLADIRTSLGGRASELVYYGEEGGVSTGASGDLISATNTAKRMICSYGMDSVLGLAAIDGNTLLSDGMSSRVYERINQIISEQMTEAVKIISENRAAVDMLVEVLLKKNHLSGDEIDAIFRSVAVQG